MNGPGDTDVAFRTFGSYVIVTVAEPSCETPSTRSGNVYGGPPTCIGVSGNCTTIRAPGGAAGAPAASIGTTGTTFARGGAAAPPPAAPAAPPAAPPAAAA